MKEPVDHIIRPLLPWRNGEGAITECGYDASKVKWITRVEWVARVKELGQQRAAMLTCMTCSDTCRRWQSWEQDPRAAIGREVEWEYGGSWRTRDDRGTRLKDELLAIAALIEAHREEFDSLTDLLRRRRDWLDQKAAAAKKPKAPREPGGL